MCALLSGLYIRADHESGWVGGGGCERGGWGGGGGLGGSSQRRKKNVPLKGD